MLLPNSQFTASDVEKSKQKDITITVLINGIPFGGMTYAIDPNKKKEAKLFLIAAQFICFNKLSSHFYLYHDIRDPSQLV